MLVLADHYRHVMLRPQMLHCAKRLIWPPMPIHRGHRTAQTHTEHRHSHTQCAHTHTPCESVCAETRTNTFTKRNDKLLNSILQRSLAMPVLNT